MLNVSLKTIAAVIKLIRPEQWVKNTFVFAPLLFSGLFICPASVSQALIAFSLFCIASSAVYILNDIKDVEKDRRHPQKKLARPIASGSISIKNAYAVLIAAYILLLLGWLVQPAVILVVYAYVLLNVVYTVKLKYYPVIDLFCIAVGFVLRVYAGALAIGVPVSSWMFITTLCLALFLAAIKRRQELRGAGMETREVLQHYSVELVDKFAEIAATGALLFYSMFILSTKPELIASIPLVIFGMFRYWYIVYQTEAGESPTEALLHDRILLLTVLAWVAFSLISL
jgi:decaprenyl-phosphate phosphoribosyltransferase